MVSSASLLPAHPSLSPWTLEAASVGCSHELPGLPAWAMLDQWEVPSSKPESKVQKSGVVETCHGSLLAEMPQVDTPFPASLGSWTSTPSMLLPSWVPAPGNFPGLFRLRSRNGSPLLTLRTDPLLCSALFLLWLFLNDCQFWKLFINHWKFSNSV